MQIGEVEILGDGAVLRKFLQMGRNGEAGVTNATYTIGSVAA